MSTSHSLDSAAFRSRREGFGAGGGGRFGVKRLFASGPDFDVFERDPRRVDAGLLDVRAVVVRADELSARAARAAAEASRWILKER